MKRKRKDDEIIESVNHVTAAEFKQAHWNAHLATHDDAYKHHGNSTFETIDTAAVELYVSPVSKVAQDDSERLMESELDACVSLVEETSADDYAASVIGWHPKRKRKEMRDKDMRYLIVRQHNAGLQLETAGITKRELSGFLSFMLTHEDGIPVIYIYEIHLKPHMRGTGMGRHLMVLVETIGSSVGVEKSMLTVFRSNDKAIRWYDRLGYGVDEYSPPDKTLRGGKVKQSDYLILSKRLKNGNTRDGEKNGKSE